MTSEGGAERWFKEAQVCRQFLRFILVGASATTIHYSVMYLLYTKFVWNGVLATTTGLLLSSAFNLWANYHFTFDSCLPIGKVVPRFVLTSTAGLVLNAAIFWLLVHGLSWFYLWGQAVATAAVTLWNFCIGRSFTYRGR